MEISNKAHSKQAAYFRIPHQRQQDLLQVCEQILKRPVQRCKYILVHCLRKKSFHFLLPLLGPIINILSTLTFFHRALLKYAKIDVKMSLVINQYLNDYMKIHQHKKGYTCKQNEGENWPHYSHTVIFVQSFPVVPSLFPIQNRKICLLLQRNLQFKARKKFEVAKTKKFPIHFQHAII